MTGYLRYANPHELSDQMKKLIEYIGRPLPKLNEVPHPNSVTQYH